MVKKNLGPKKGPKIFWTQTNFGYENLRKKVKKLWNLPLKSVTAEIFLICTNVARKNVAWIPVNLIV